MLCVRMQMTSIFANSKELATKTRNKNTLFFVKQAREGGEEQQEQQQKALSLLIELRF